jgi:hypothetical protein
VQRTVILPCLILELLPFKLYLGHNSETTRGVLFQNLFWEHHLVQTGLCDYIFLTLSFIYGKNSYFDKADRTFILNFPFKDLFKPFICLLLEKVKI